MRKPFLERLRRLDLQAKVILILVSVIIPTFTIVTIIENQLTSPLLKEEMKQIGITTGKTLATHIVTRRLLALSNPTPSIEAALQDLISAQPSITRMDVVVRDPVTHLIKVVASNYEEDALASPPSQGIVDAITSQITSDDDGIESWEIRVPIEQKFRDPKQPKILYGNIHVVVSMKALAIILETLWQITATAAAFSVVMLILALSYFLRKTLATDRKLRRAESENLQLTEQLHETQRQLMNMEKLAVMGQLTASFAHEIGTPLNAVGGHLQLLKEEVRPNPATNLGERFGIIDSQLQKIETIVKNFLQSTAKPTSQRQLVDLNRIVEQTLGIVRPRLEAMSVEVRRDLHHEMGPVRVVPVELEQILLNLVNNSLDSLKSKSRERRDKGRTLLEVATEVQLNEGRQWAMVSVYDTGQGIRKVDLPNVLKPFFTTKGPGEGTGLGLTICEQLARKYGGMLEIDSKEGAWTKVTLMLPYQSVN